MAEEKGGSTLMNKKLYTVSTYTFKSLKEAEKKLEEWDEDETLNAGSKVFRVTECYVPKIKLIRKAL